MHKSLETKKELMNSIRYIAEKTSQLSEKIIGKKLPISSLTVFSHDEKEFENLKNILATMGAPYNENNGPRVALHQPIQIGENSVTHLRIRKPDPERPQVGCNDFDVDSYEDFKKEYLGKSEYLKLITRPEYEMIEFAHPDFDVLAYVISK